jgi:hypothetical protein
MGEKRKFTELSPVEKANVIERWNIRGDRETLYVDEHYTPFVKMSNCYVLAGTVRAESLICGGFHNRQIRKNPQTKINQVL